MIDALANKGIAIIGNDQHKADQSVAIIGTARGGTSMVAGLLANLGVYMGAKAVAPVYEDTQLANFFEDKDIDHAEIIVKQYSKEHLIWGFKRPSSVNYLTCLDELMEKPKYIFIFRDILSIALRNKISMQMNIISGMAEALSQYREALNFLEKEQCNAMLVSYDKALVNPTYFVAEIIKFCHLEPSEEQIQEAIKFINPMPQAYLDITRNTKAQGHLDNLENRKINGWAHYIHKSSPAEVAIYLNNELIGSTIANLPRADLYEKFSQNCAFTFNIPDHINLVLGSTIRVKVTNEVNDLLGSPFVILEENRITEQKHEQYRCD